MRVNERMKKVFSILLCLCMVLQYVPTTAFAVTTAESGLCEHHAEHTAECGYAEAVAGSGCTHSHDELCGYIEAVAGADCTHVHDNACGYVAAVEGHECHYECAECAIAPANEEPGDETPVCSCTVKCGETVDTNCAVCSAAGADLSAVCNGAEETPVAATDNIDAAAMTAEELKAAVDAALAAGYTAITVNLAEDADATMFSAITAALATTVDPSLDQYELVMNYSGTIDLTISGAKTVPECTFYVDEYVNENWRAGAALWSVTLTDATTIGESAFAGSAMTSFSAPNVIAIEDYAFTSCMNLTDVYLPSVQTLGGNVFFECYTLKTISLPECIDLGNGVFNSCEALETVYAPKATNLGAIEFMMCTSLMKVTLGSVVSVNQLYNSIDNGLFCLANDTKNIELILDCNQKALSFDSGTKYWTATEEAFAGDNQFIGYTFKSITLAHTPVADDGDCTTAVMCSTCGEIAVEAKESHITEKDENKANCQKKAKCDLCGTSYGEVDPENHTKDTCTNGFYDCCNAYQPAELVDGVYQIGNAGQLFWFAELVNSGTKNTNAALTADIDLEGRTCTPIAQTASYHASAITDTGYTGIFDGQNHEIRNFTVECAADGEGILSYGLFGTVSGTVKNLGIDNFSFDATATGKADCRAGGIAGQVLTGGRIENCFAVNSSILTGSRIAGGIAGCNYGGTIANCFAYNNTVTGHSRCAAIVGDTVTDSGAPTKLIGYVTNCYADKAPAGSQNGGDTYITSCEQKSAEQFQSGEVAFLLGEAWGQTPGEGLPVLGGEPVKQASDGTYYNDIIQVTIVWTSMEFTYGETWNPETLQYEESWTASGDGAVTVTNEGTMTVNAEFAYAQTYTPVTGSFTQPTLALPPKETETTQLLLSGKPGEDLENQELGTITVTIHRATN